MAIYQYRFQIIPKNEISKLSISYSSENDIFDEEVFWEGQSIKKEIFDKIENTLKKRTSWSSNITLFGDLESNCFEVYSDSTGKVYSVSFRIDFRSGYEDILMDIFEFCLLNDMVILDEKIHLLPFSIESTNEIVRKSPQFEKYEFLQRNQNV